MVVGFRGDGTLLAGQRLAQRHLKDCDVLALAEDQYIEYRFRVTAEAWAGTLWQPKRRPETSSACRWDTSPCAGRVGGALQRRIQILAKASSMREATLE